MLLSLLITSQSLRALTGVSGKISIMLAISVIPLVLGAFVIALTATEVAFEGSSQEIISFYQSFVRSEQ
jgi:hypothetical protein